MRKQRKTKPRKRCHRHHLYRTRNKERVLQQQRRAQLSLKVSIPLSEMTHLRFQTLKDTTISSFALSHWNFAANTDVLHCCI